MLKLIVGTKGSGKTKTMIDMIDKATKLYQHRNVLKYRRENRDKAPEAPKES